MRRPPSSIVASALSGLIPGLGHLYAGERRRAWWFLAATAVFVAPATLLALAPQASPAFEPAGDAWQAEETSWASSRAVS